jgi:PAS domain S-box-containing protein
MEELEKLKEIIEDQTRMLMEKNRLLAQMESRLKQTIVSGSRKEDLAKFQLQLSKDAIEGQSSLLKTILGSIPLGLIVVDSKQNIISYNRAAQEIMGFSGEEVMGKPCAPFMGEDSVVFTRLQEAMTTGEAQEQAEVRVPLKKDRQAVLSLKIVPVVNTVGSVVGGVNIFSDITNSVVRETLLHEKNDSLVRVLARVMEKKDDYILAHSERVKDLALKMAGKMGMSSTGQQRNILYASLLHDIGLLSVPDEILHGKGAVSERPYNLLKAHPVDGEWMLNQVEGFGDIKKIVRSHHERFDGGGYPDGLLGEEIPVASRIIGLVEAYDAMLHDKASQRRPRQDIFQEIHENRGSQFDPDMVDLFLNQVVGDGA